MQGQSLRQDVRELDKNEVRLSVKTSTSGISPSLLRFGPLIFVGACYFTLRPYNLGIFPIELFYLFYFFFVLHFWGMIGNLNMDARKIAFVSFMGGRHQLQWDEICEAETDAQNRQLVFLSFDGKKRLAIPAPQFWFGKEKEAMTKLLAEELQKCGLEIKETGRAAFFQSKS